MQTEYRKNYESPKFFDKDSQFGNGDAINEYNEEYGNINVEEISPNNIVGEFYDDNTVQLKFHTGSYSLFYEDKYGKILDGVAKITDLP